MKFNFCNQSSIRGESARGVVGYARFKIYPDFFFNLRKSFLFLKYQQYRIFDQAFT